MRKYLIVFFVSICPYLSSQPTLTIKGQTYSSTETGTWNGVEIVKSSPTLLRFLDNSISSVNSNGYLLLAGDEIVSSTNNHLDGALISGNKLTWKGTIDAGQHGIFVGYNKNDIIKYNYLESVPYGVIFKSGNSAGSNMTYTSGGFAYNIIRNSDIAVRVKGINGICIYNNTFYDSQHTNVPAIIYITNNPDNGASPSVGTKIKNNIFYTVSQIANIYVENGSEQGLESDYNVFYCESGQPVFSYHGQQRTFAQWQALGYDLHSHVINPNFVDINSLIPSARLDYGTDLGSEWATGLSVDAVWSTNDPSMIIQNSTWQAGALIYGATGIGPVDVSSVVENSAPSVIEMTYNMNLAAIVPAASAFIVKVNSVIIPVTTVSVTGQKVFISLGEKISYNDVVSISYVKPPVNGLQSQTGDQSSSFDNRAVINNIINQVPEVTITSPSSGSVFSGPATIPITVSASDPDGSIKKMIYYNGNSKIGETDIAPYSFTWTNVISGQYSITAAATDNFDAVTISVPVQLNVNTSIDPNSDLINIYPIPNDGNFIVNVNMNFENASNIISVVDITGRQVYKDVLLKDQKSKEFNLSFLNPGTYIMLIIGRNILITKKFIKN